MKCFLDYALRLPRSLDSFYFSKGDFFGEMDLLQNERVRTASARTIADFRCRNIRVFVHFNKSYAIYVSMKNAI